MGGTSRILDLASARAATRLGWLRAELRARCAYPRPRGADPERTPICIWVSSTGFRQPGLLCAFRRRLVTVHVSPVSPSLNKEGNAACARQVCRKVTTRETRDQRRISTWYQNLRVLSAQVRGEPQCGRARCRRSRCRACIVSTSSANGSCCEVCEERANSQWPYNDANVCRDSRFYVEQFAPDNRCCCTARQHRSSSTPWPHWLAGEPHRKKRRSSSHRRDSDGK